MNTYNSLSIRTLMEARNDTLIALSQINTMQDEEELLAELAMINTLIDSRRSEYAL